MIEGIRYSPEEINVIRSVFDSCDGDGSGKIHINQISGFLTKLGKSEDELIRITEGASKIADDNEGLLTFEDLIILLQQNDSPSDFNAEGPDPKVVEFLRILEEYRIKCEDEGNYLEAGRAFRQLGVLRKQEEKRQQKAIQARQLAERQDVQLAHNLQFSEFNKQWDRYMEEYDNMAQMYIQQMTERHAIVLMEFQKQLRTELASKPPKWSRELMDQRRQQHINARNKNYTTAQKLKKISDKNEEKERKEMEQEQAIIFARREAKYRQQQQTELSALLKRIECRRKEHIKQRNLDTKRLLQRNKNVQAVLEQKQNAEAQKLFADIKKFLYGTAILHGGQAPSSKTGTNYNISNSYGNNNTNNSYNNSKQFSDNQARDEYKMHEDSPSNDNDIRNNSNSNNSNSYYEDETHKQDGKDNSRDDNASYPQFLQQPGPNFNEMVYNSQDSFGEDED